MDLTFFILLVVFGLQQAITISIAAHGELITEKAGVLNIGIEGVMLVSAFVAAVVNFELGRPLGDASSYAGLAAGMATGVAMNFLFAIMSTKLHVDQVIAGIGINIFAVGITYVISQEYFTIDGTPVSHAVPALFHVGGLAANVAPKVSPLMVVMFVLPVVVFFFLGRMKFGLHIRAVGENPKAAEAAGIKVVRTRILATTLGGALLGMAGSYLTVDFFNQFTPNITGGIGFIALAAVIAGGWNPGYILGVSVLFGGSVGLIYVVAATGPLFYLISMLPYIITVAVLGIASKRLRPPSALAVPYKKE